MTEPAVASSDATNIESSIRATATSYVINGRKWWTSGAAIRAARFPSSWARPIPTAPQHKQQSMILVPMDTPGVKIVRLLTVFGYDHAPHGHAEVSSKTCACRSRIFCWARAADLKSRRAGSDPGRIHHCMRLIGVAERALETMCSACNSRVAFGKPLADQGTIRG